MKNVIFVLSVCVLVSCSTGMNREECQTADWYKLGLADAKQSAMASRIETYQKACLRYDIIANQNEFERGRMDAMGTNKLIAENKIKAVGTKQKKSKN